MVTALTLRPSFSVQFGDGLVDCPDVLERAVNVGVLGAGDRQAGGVRTRSHHQLVVFVVVAGRGHHALGSGVDFDGALAGLQGQGLVVPHGRFAQGEVHVGFREGLAQGHAVVGEVGFLSQDRNLPTFKTAVDHGVRETVGSRTAADDDDAARVLCT